MTTIQCSTSLPPSNECCLRQYSKYFSPPPPRTTTVTHRYLPYLSCLWLTENSIVCAGYDCYPVLWNHDDGGELTYINKLDQKEKKAEGRIR